MASSISPSSSIPLENNIKRSLNDLQWTKEVDHEKGLKKRKKDDVTFLSEDKESEAPERVMSAVNDSDSQKDLQERLYCNLNSELIELGEILKLPENVRGLVHSCLKYVMNKPELVSASDKKDDDGSGGGERNVVCAVVSSYFTGDGMVVTEGESTSTSFHGVSPDIEDHNGSTQVEAANSHPQDDSYPIDDGAQGSVERHETNNSDQSVAELVYDQIEFLHQTDEQDSNHYLRQADEIPSPKSEMCVSETIAEPLENELERINKERGEAIALYEEKRRRLDVECEKEISEIRRKYDAKLEEIESEFVMKKKELDANHEIVVMNKILADTLRDMNTKSPTSFGTKPDSQQQHVEVPCSPPNEGEVGCSKRKWTCQEDVFLAKCWISLSENTRAGNNQKGVNFWKRVSERFTARFGEGKSTKAVKNHWHAINKSVSRFNGIYRFLEMNWGSNWSDDQLMDCAREMYIKEMKNDQTKEKKYFDYEHVWKILRVLPKWEEIGMMEAFWRDRGGKRFKTSTSGDYTTSDPIDLNVKEETDVGTKVRPVGKKVINAKRTGKVNDIHVVDDTSPKVQVVQRILKDVTKEVVDVNAEMETVRLENTQANEMRSLHKEEQRSRSEEMWEYEVLMKDTSKMNSIQLRAHNEMVQKIIQKKWGGN